MSHDIRTPMNAIIGFTALLDRMIEVDSELGKGTTITITVEFSIAKNEKSADSNKKNTVKQSENGGGRILLAEDNDLNAEIAVTLLKEREFEVDRAKDGAVCIDMVKEKPVDYYNLILMDIQMPKMDGYKATQEIRHLPDKDKACIPIIAMTASAFEEDKREAIASGMNGHIAKPIDVNELMAILVKNTR